MLRSMIISAMRHFARHQVFSLLNLSGLVIGIVAAIILFLYVFDELRVDRYHPDNERTFMVLRDVTLLDGQKFTGETMPGPIADFVRSTLSGVEATCQTGFYEKLLVSGNQKTMYVEGTFAEESFLKVFNLKLRDGNEQHPFADRNSILISSALASTLFKEEPALGKILLLNNTLELKISGVYEIPEKATVRYDFLAPFEYHRLQEPSSWDDSNAHLYVKLKDVKNKRAVEKLLTEKVHEAWQSKGTTVFLFALSDRYRDWDKVVLHHATSKMTIIVCYAVTAVLILFMACINFINLSTARAATRAREIGVRKMAGANHSALIRHFMAEHFAISLIATLLALIAVVLVLPVFNTMLNTHLSLFKEPRILITVILITFFVALLAGGYPAFFLSSLKPASILKGQLQMSFYGAGLRKALVVFQFTLSIILIFSALTTNKQVNYIQNKQLGFDKDNVLYIEPGQEVNFNVAAFREKALQNPHVLSVSEAAASPMEINGVTLVQWNPGGGQQEANFVNCPVDYDYLPTLGFELVQGRNFSKSISTDSTGVIITENAANQLGYENPIGEKINFGFNGHIIGVVKDFHNANIHDAVSPVIFYLGDEAAFGRWKRIFVRYTPGSQLNVTDYLKKVAKEVNPHFPFEFIFVDQDFDRQFRADIRTEIIVHLFTIVALVIACIGLFGLALFTTQRRTREIAVRKVLGATTVKIALMLGQLFLSPLIISLIIALPFAYWIMNQFLSTYEFHIDITLPLFFATGFIIFALALLTVLYQSVRAAQQNPANALKNE